MSGKTGITRAMLRERAERVTEISDQLFVEATKLGGVWFWTTPVSCVDDWTPTLVTSAEVRERLLPWLLTVEPKT